MRSGAYPEQRYTSLSLFRIAFALCLLGDYTVNLSAYVGDFLSDDGVLPLHLIAHDWQGRAPPSINLLAVTWLENIGLRAVLPIVYPCAMVALCIGYRTRMATGLCLLFGAYIYWRNPFARSGADALANLLLLWCLFVPLNRHWSIDALRADAVLRQQPVHPLPLIAIRVQIASLYVFSGLYKAMGSPWREGSAVASILQDTMFGATTFDRWLLTEASALLPVANYAVMAFQLMFPLLIYSPFYRTASLAAGLTGSILLHVSFIFCLSIGGFPYLCLAMLLILVPDHWISPAWLHRSLRVTWRAARRWSPLAHAVLMLPITAPAVASGRKARFSPLSSLRRQRTDAAAADGAVVPVGHDRPATPGLPKGLSAFSLAACGSLMVLALAGNVEGLARPETQRTPFYQLLEVLQVAQRWTLFAPEPTAFTWTFRASVEIGADSLQLERFITPALFWTSDAGKQEFANHRWLKYFSRFAQYKAEHWQALGSYLCRRVAAATTAAPAVVKFHAQRSSPDHEFDVGNHVFKCRSANHAT